MNAPKLYVFSGLPGVGKSTLAQQLAAATNAAYLRIDTIEQGLRDLCSFEVEGEGYRLAYRVAGDNLRIGISVVADSCNPIELTRNEWERVAADLGVPWVNIEVQCSDAAEHQHRIETRESPIEGLRLPTWADVEAREWHPWSRPRITVDSAGKTREQSFSELISLLG